MLFSRWRQTLRNNRKGIRKSNQPFIRIQIESENQQKFLRPFNQSIPTEIVIGYEGFKAFKNVTIRTQVGPQIIF